MNEKLTTPDPTVEIVAQISQALVSIRQAPSSEKELQQKMAELFQRHGIAFEREFQLETGPVDFVVGSLAVEVKIHGSVLEASRQIIRYLQEERFTAGLIVTTRAMMPWVDACTTPQGKKPIKFIQLWRQFL